jgi:hypothetical protein
MTLPQKTSRLLDLHEKVGMELSLRLGEIFKRYRGLAFAGRNDQLFAEHWTPELAASGYDFAAYEIRGEEISLHGVERTHGFEYRISITFPLSLVDDSAKLHAHFTERYAEIQSRTQVAVSSAQPNATPAL